MSLSFVTDLLRTLPLDLRPGSAGHGRRVVHLLPTLGWGGAERIGCTVHRLARANGWHSRIDAPSVDIVREGVIRETGDGALNASDPREVSLRGWALAARARIAAERPTLVHAHLPYPDRITAALIASRARPMVVTFQLLPQRERSWSPDEILHQRSDRVLAALARVSWRTRFVAVSSSDRERLSQLIPSRRVSHIANVAPLAPALDTSLDLAPIVWPADQVRVLSVGRLHSQKGFDRMIAALAAPRVRAMAWHWVIAGDGPERASLGEAIDTAGLRDRVTFASARPAHGLFPTADLVLSPSRSEGMPLVPMEAIEAGVPVLASGIDAHRELFGRIAASFLPDDEAHWPEALLRLLSDFGARTTLAREQRSVLPADPRRDLWEAYAALYRAVTAE